MSKLPAIVLGTWSWGTGAVGGDQVFGNNLTNENLKPVFDAAMKSGLRAWDTATVYGMGASEDILGAFVKHWHGATAGSWFAHLAIEVPGEGASNEWLEVVTDEDYDKLTGNE